MVLEVLNHGTFRHGLIPRGGGSRGNTRQDRRDSLLRQYAAEYLLRERTLSNGREGGQDLHEQLEIHGYFPFFCIESKSC